MEIKAEVAWGIGLRHQFLAELEDRSALPVLEVISDNLLYHRGGPALGRTQRLAERTVILLHGVGLNIASADALDLSYVRELKRLKQALRATLVSDHLAFTRSGGIATYELLPIPRNLRYLKHLVERISRVQDLLQTALLLENISAYVEHPGSTMSEGEFLSELVSQSGCRVLLDVNNLYVNAVNFSFCAVAELKRFPWSAVEQIHIAGHTAKPGYLFDTHDQPAVAPVISLLASSLKELKALGKTNVPVIVEWDEAGCALDVPLAEVERIQTKLQTADKIPLLAPSLELQSYA